MQEMAHGLLHKTVIRKDEQKDKQEGKQEIGGDKEKRL